MVLQATYASNYSQCWKIHFHLDVKIHLEHIYTRVCVFVYLYTYIYIKLVFFNTKYNEIIHLQQMVKMIIHLN